MKKRSEVPDAEALALASSPEARALLDEGRRAGAVPLEEIDRRRPISSRERQQAEEYLDALERLEAQQGRAASEDQAHLANVILVAAHHLADGRSLADWAAEAGLAEAEIAAGVAALEALGLKRKAVATHA